MPRLYISGNAVDQNQIPVIGAQVFVRAGGINAEIEDASGAPLANPVLTIADGFFEAFSSSSGTHTLEYYWGGRLRRVDTVSEIDRIQAIADSAAASAASAEAFAGPTYASTAAGIAGTTDGDFFAVNASGIVTIYLNDGGSAVAQRTIVTETALSASTGAALIGTSRGSTVEAELAALDGAGPQPVVARVPIAASDENSPLTTGSAKVTFRLPAAFTLTSVFASVNTAPTGAPLVVDINADGASLLSTKLSIDAGEESSATAAAPAVIGTPAIAAGAEISVDIDQIGSVAAGTGLKVWLVGTYA